MNEEHVCTPELMREHERRLTEVQESAKSAHKRMDNLEDFKESMLEMNTNIRVIAEQIKTMAQTLLRHEGAIEDIQEKMETKEGMARLYQTVEDIQLTQDKQDKRISKEENKEAEAALAAMNKIKWTFEKDIVSTHIINNALYILFSDGDLVNMSLELPGDIDDVSYLDTYNSIDTASNYNSYIVFSEFFYRGANGKGTARGRYQIRSMKYTIEDNSRYITDIISLDQLALVPDNIFGPTWDDTGDWIDDDSWYDVNPLYTRTYTDDDKVSVMSDSKRVQITFRSSDEEPSKGFELATVNLEGFFHQRSTRV